MKSKILLSILTASIMQGCGGAEAKCTVKLVYSISS
jgi:hypothetical protein